MMKFPHNIYKVVESFRGKQLAVGKTYIMKHQATRFRNSNQAWFGGQGRTFTVYEFPVGEGKPIE